MPGTFDNENGNIYIDSEVVARFAGHAALDCFGRVGMASRSMKDGLAKLLRGDNVSRGVTVKKTADGLIINFHIIVSYGVNIKTVVKNLVSTVKYQVEDYTSMDVKAINVFVEGVRVID